LIYGIGDGGADLGITPLHPPHHARRSDRHHCFVADDGAIAERSALARFAPVDQGDAEALVLQVQGAAHSENPGANDGDVTA
jgi:hypothetical protein